MTNIDNSVMDWNDVIEDEVVNNSLCKEVNG